MYLSYYGLRSKPFQISADPRFIWLGEKHKEALATLTYGVLDNKGFMLLTGDVGTGKTTLINTLISNLKSDVLHAFVPDPRLELTDFFNYVARAFKLNREFKSKGSFLLHFSDFLERAYAENKKVLLLIDEAQLLTQDLLEEIRLLSNIQKDGNNLLNIFFIGQNEFNQILERSENRAVAQRLTLNYHLNPLSEVEVGRYIRHRLKVAGTTERLFDNGAVQQIHGYSGGFPRRINIICDHCLLNGYVKEKRLIDAGMVRICAHDLKIPQYTQKVVPPPRPIPPSTHHARPEPVAPARPAAHIPKPMEGSPAHSSAPGEYASGNDDVRTGLVKEPSSPFGSRLVTPAVVIGLGLLILVVMTPETFINGYQRLIEKLAPVQQGQTEMVTPQNTVQERAEGQPEVAEQLPGSDAPAVEGAKGSAESAAGENELPVVETPAGEPAGLESERGAELETIEAESSDKQQEKAFSKAQTAEESKGLADSAVGENGLPAVDVPASESAGKKSERGAELEITEAESSDKQPGTELSEVRTLEVPTGSLDSAAGEQMLPVEDLPTSEPAGIERETGGELENLESEPPGEMPAKELVEQPAILQADDPAAVEAVALLGLDDPVSPGPEGKIAVREAMVDNTVGHEGALTLASMEVAQAEETDAVTLPAEIEQVAAELGQVGRLDSPPKSMTAAPEQPAVVTTEPDKQHPKAAKKQPMTRYKKKDVAVAPAAKAQQVLILRFNYDSSQFEFDKLVGLEALVALLKQRPKATIRISGHTDSQGSPGYNRRLSLSRANMLRSYFLGKGVAPERMIVRGYGSRLPVASNSTAVGRSQNRRVEIELVE